MKKRCGKKNRCNTPRARWWKKQLKVDWFDYSSSTGNQLVTDAPESQMLMTDDGNILTTD